jgi:hypothetical protein
MPDIGYVPSIQADVAERRGWVTGRAVLVGAIVAGAALAASRNTSCPRLGSFQERKRYCS